MYLKNFLELLLCGVEIYIALFCCIGALEKKEHFAIRQSVALAVCIAFSALYALLPTFTPEIAKDYWRILFYVAVNGMLFTAFYFSYRMTVYELLIYANFAWTSLFFFENTFEVISALITNGGGAINIWLAYLIRYVLFASIYTAVYFTVVMFYKGKNAQFRENKSAGISCLLFFVVCVLLMCLETVVSRYDRVYLIIFDFCEAFYGVVALIIAFAFIQQTLSNSELLLVKRLWEEDRKHYELQKENIEIINIKCHDLRHQIQNFRRNGEFGERALAELENSIHIYDAVVKTQNDVLDVILSDMTLRCQKNDIQLTCMADGTLIGFMDEMDVYSLFGNVMENALEYEQTVSDKENRFIALQVKRQGDAVSIHAENYFIGDVRISDDLVTTTKTDRNDHGFGMKSMKRIAEKYGGNFHVMVADEMFQVDIRIPLPKKREV